MNPETPDIVKINLDAEVRKLAVADGVQDSSELEKVVGVRRYDQYAAQVRAHFHGYDVGYAEGVALMGRPLRRHVLNVAAMALLTGVIIGVGLVYIIR